MITLVKLSGKIRGNYKNNIENISIVVMEECAELTQAISKRIRNDLSGTDFKTGLMNEMADVIIILSMLQRICHIGCYDLLGAVEKKMKRNIERIEQSG